MRWPTKRQIVETEVRVLLLCSFVLFLISVGRFIGYELQRLFR